MRKEQKAVKYTRANINTTNVSLSPAWKLDQIAKLDIQGLADNPSFIFLWVGSQHLDDGRQLFNKWGFKRCQDICWVKTHNKKQIKKDLPTDDPSQIFIRTKEHCLVGLKGDSKKASDPTFIHPNIDTDVVVCQQFDFGSTQKPQEVYEIIERFCLGRKRIQLFGNVMREGWLTVGMGLVEQNYSPEYLTWFQGDDMYPSRKDYKGGRKVGTTPDIENNRPKSPAKQATAPATNQPVTLKI